MYSFLLSPSASAMGINPEGKNIFLKQMAVARSIFTLGGWVQSFWTAFDMPRTGVPLEVALGWQKFYFLAFKKIIMQVGVKCNIMIIFLNAQKKIFVS